MTDSLLLVARLLLAAVFAAAAIGKITDRAASREAIERFGVPPVLGPVMAVALPALELTIAVALLVTASAHVASLAAVALLVAFSLGIARVLLRREAVDCRCFGSLSTARVGPGTLARNLILLVPAMFIATAGADSAGRSLGDVGAGVLVVGVLMTMQAAFSWQLFKQNGRLLVRMTALEDGLGLQDPAPSTDSLAIGDSAPGFDLPDLAGDRVTLDDLLAAGRGALLVFTDPACGHCDPLLPALGRPRGEDAPPLAIISRGPLAANRARAEEHGIAGMLLQDDFEVADAYRAFGLPGAVLVDAGGRIANVRAVGADEVAALLEPHRPLDVLHVGARA